VTDAKSVLSDRLVRAGMNPGRGKEPGEVGFDLRAIPVRLGSEPVRRIRASAELATLSFGPATYPSTDMLM
jgi:hypothetical protein